MISCALSNSRSPRKCVRPLFSTFLSPAATVFFAASLCVLAFSLGCSKDAAEKEPTVAVEIVPVEKKTIQHTVETDAVLFPLAQSAITPKINAPVQKFYVQRGSKVHQGELLATLENKDLAAAAQDNKGAYDQAQAVYATTTGASLPEELQKAELDTNAAKQEMDAQEKVYKSRQDLFEQGALPRKELDQGLVDYTTARNQYEMAMKHLEALQKFGNAQGIKGAAGQLESAKGKYLGAEASLSYSEIRSPIDGVVTDRPLYPGEMASAGNPLLTVMDISRVIARAHIPQREVASLMLGDAASILVPGAPPDAKPYEGKITVISPALDPNSTTVEVWAEFKNPEQRLKPGTSVQLSIVASSIPDAVIIPADSILTAPDGTTSVMLVGADSRAHQKNVTVGVKQGDDVQIIEGLKDGDKIVAVGAYGLPDNTKIQATSAGTGKDAGDKTKNEK
jgi:HlyD family secretion protein